MNRFKKIVKIFGVFVLICFTMFGTDYLRTKNSKEPIFAIKTSGEQEVTKTYIGLFYVVEFYQGYTINVPEEPYNTYTVDDSYKIYSWFDKDLI